VLVESLDTAVDDGGDPPDPRAASDDVVERARLGDGFVGGDFEADSGETADDGEVVGSVLLEASRLPSDAQHANAIFSVTLSGGRIESASYEPDQTAIRTEAAQDRFDRLSKRPPSDEDT